MRDPKISPNGLGSAIQMCVFFINRAGRKIPPRQKANIQKAVEWLRLEHQWLKHAERFELDKQPKPVFPMPPVGKRVGGRYGYNRRKV